MANAGYVASLVGSLDAATKRVLNDVFTYVLQNLRLGRPVHQGRAENLQLYFLSGRTATVAGTEFSIAHGMGSAPYLVIPVLDVQTVNAEIVPLGVPRAADASRIYLSSSVEDAPFMVLVEGPT
jgi:hypothetical protein